MSGPQGACNIILACIVLQDIATRCNVPLCDVIYDAPDPVEDQDPSLAVSQNEGLTGLAIRDAIVRNHF